MRSASSHAVTHAKRPKTIWRRAMVLAFIHRHPQGISGDDIGPALGLSHTLLAVTLDELDALRLVERCDPPRFATRRGPLPEIFKPAAARASAGANRRKHDHQR